MTDNNVVTPTIKTTTIDELRNIVNNFKSNPDWLKDLEGHAKIVPIGIRLS